VTSAPPVHDAAMPRIATARGPWWTLFLSVSASMSGGCSAVTTMYPASDLAGSPRQTPVAGTPYLDCKGIVHCHSRLSHDSEGTIDEIAAACRDACIDFVVMTDHQTDASIRDGVRGMVEDTLFLVGAEVRSPQGTLLCFPLQKPLRRFQHPSLLAKEAAEQGGLAFVCHGELWKVPFAAEGILGAEIVNLHSGAMTANRVGTLATGLFLSMRTLSERICWRDEMVLSGWDAALATRHPFTPVGGNDAHANVRVFGPLGGTIGNYREIFLTLSTHVLAERLDEASVTAAFAAGRTYVSFDAFGEGSGFDFRIVDGGGAVHLGGAEVLAAPGLVLRVTTPAVGRIRLLRDGQELHQREASTLLVRDPEPGIYRVEVATRNGDPWLFSSSIRVVAAERDQKTNAAPR
jgi:hypothetical protein